MSMNPGARIASRGRWIEARASASPKLVLSIRPCEILTDPGPCMAAPSKMCRAAIVTEEDPAWPISIAPRMANGGHGPVRRVPYKISYVHQTDLVRTLSQTLALTLHGNKRYHVSRLPTRRRV